MFTPKPKFEPLKKRDYENFLISKWFRKNKRKNIFENSALLKKFSKS